MMQYEPKMDVMDTSDTSWFECFIEKSRVAQVLTDPNMRKDIPKLCIQFTEKGFMAEKEKEKNKLEIEESNYYDRKAASMRLCAMACFAALDWDFDYIIDNVSRYELLALRVLVDQSYRMYNEKNLDATFGNWLFYRFCLSLDRRYRLPPPLPKATFPSVYQQIHSADLAFIRFDKVQRMIMELREHVAKARAFLSEMVDQPRDVVAPGMRCFLEPFEKMAPRSLATAFVGDRDVLVETPAPDFDLDKILLPAVDIANKCRAELVTFCFTNGELEEAKRIMTMIEKPKSEIRLVAIDEKMFRAYSMCLSVKGPFTESGTEIKHMVFDQKILSDDNSLYRKSELMRDRAEEETSGQLQMVYQAENAARCIIDGQAECVREKLGPKILIERFVRSLKRQLEHVKSPERRVWINGYLQFLCATSVDLKSGLAKSGIDVSKLRDVAMASPSLPAKPMPTSDMIDALIQSTDSWWKLITRFRLTILKEAMVELSKLGKYWHPQTMPHSEFLNDIVASGATSPNHNMQRLLLGKLEQLARMRMSLAFTSRLQEYFVEMEGSLPQNQWALHATFESLHVQASIGNGQSMLPYEKVLGEPKVEQISLIFKADFAPNENSARMINQCMAILLNQGEFKTVLEKGGNIPIDKFPSVPIARLLGAYANNMDDQSLSRKCADGFSRNNSPKFVAAQQKGRRSREGVLINDPQTAAAKRELSHMLHLFQLIRHPQLVAFILAYIVSLHNRVVTTTRKPHLKIHAKLLPLFGNDNTPIEIANTEDIRECLRIMCKRALEVSRTDPDTLHTCADFHYIEGDYQLAGQRYLEYFAAHSYNLKPLATDQNIFQDLLLHRIRLVLAHSGYLTMSLMICQYMKGPRADEYKKALTLLANNLTRDVGANCAMYIIDTNAVEYLSSHYNESTLTKSMNTLFAGGSSLATNKNVAHYLVQQETNRRTAKFIQALASIFFGMGL